jgi:outer membrane protein, heavy metal efflux system
MWLRGIAPSGALLIAALAGCIAYYPRFGWPETYASSGEIVDPHGPVRPESRLYGAPLFEEPTGIISLREALALALAKNPVLAAFSWEVRAREAQMLQTGLLPNPEFSVLMEDVGGSGGFRGVQQTQTTITLSQLIELGGKRAARMQATSLTRDLAGWDYEVRRIETLTQVSQAFTETLAAQQRQRLAEELVNLAEEVARSVIEKVKAGKVSPIEETKANIALSSVRIEQERARLALEAARTNLAATWGSTTARLNRAEGDLDQVAPLPRLESLVERVARNPVLARWAAEMAQRQALVQVERANAIPDITINGGYRRLNETDDNSLVFGVSVPLPLFNRNQGSIVEARHRLAKAEAERRAAEVRVTSALSDAYKALATAHAEAVSLKANVLPAAQSAFDGINEGYRLGKFGYLDVLDAQRTLFDARARYLQAVTDYHKAVAEVERLVGEPLATIQTDGT